MNLNENLGRKERITIAEGEQQTCGEDINCFWFYDTRA